MAKKKEVIIKKEKKQMLHLFKASRHVLPENVMLTGIIGMLIIIALGFFGRSIPEPWAWAFGLVFGIMIVGSFVSMRPVK